MRVLLRSWPKGGGQGLERAVARAACDVKDGEQFYIPELGYSLPVHRRAEPPTEGFDAELRFEVSMREHDTLRLSWDKLTGVTDCQHCQHQKI